MAAAPDPQQAAGAAAIDSSQHAPAAVASTVGVQQAVAGGVADALSRAGPVSVAPGGTAQHPVVEELKPSIRLPSRTSKPLSLVAMVVAPSAREAR
jgi:hypothetical protein